MCYKEYGWGPFNSTETVLMEMRTPEEQQKWLKILYKKDSVKYFEWKKWNIESNFLPDIFGTMDAPIDLHENEW